MLSLVDSTRFQLHISTMLLAEYEAVLKRGLPALSAQPVDDVVNFLCARATHHKIFYLWRPVLKNPGDDFLLELAVKAQSSIVTWNIADFKRAQSLGVVVQTPRDFLKFLEENQP
jgi:predicted nucleic acid-binding protein